MQPINQPTAIALIGSTLYLLGAAFTFWRREHRPQATRIALIYSTLSLLWALEQALRQMAWLGFLAEDFLYRIPLYGILILAIAFLFLTRTFLRPRGYGLGQWMLGIVWVTGLLFLDQNLLSLPDILVFRGGWTLSRQGIVILLIIAGWAVFMGGATLLTAQALGLTSRYFVDIS